MSNLPQLNQGLSSLRTPDRMPERVFNSGLREIRLFDNGDIARFYFLDDSAITTHLFHETPKVSQNNKPYFKSRICLRRVDPMDGGDLDPAEVCPYCISENENVQRRMLRMVGVVFHEWTAHRNKTSEADRQAFRGEEGFWLTDVNQPAIYLTKSKRTVTNLKRFAAERGSLVDVMSYPDMATPGSGATATKVDGKSQPFEVIKIVDGRTSYEIEARQPELTPQALLDARANIPNLAEIVAKEYMEDGEAGDVEDTVPTVVSSSNLPPVSF